MDVLILLKLELVFLGAWGVESKKKKKTQPRPLALFVDKGEGGCILHSETLKEKSENVFLPLTVYKN